MRRNRRVSRQRNQLKQQQVLTKLLQKPKQEPKQELTAAGLTQQEDKLLEEIEQGKSNFTPEEFEILDNIDQRSLSRNTHNTHKPKQEEPEQRNRPKQEEPEQQKTFLSRQMDKIQCKINQLERNRDNIIETTMLVKKQNEVAEMSSDEKVLNEKEKETEQRQSDLLEFLNTPEEKRFKELKELKKNGNIEDAEKLEKQELEKSRIDRFGDFEPNRVQMLVSNKIISKKQMAERMAEKMIGELIDEQIEKLQRQKLKMVLNSVMVNLDCDIE